MVSAIRMISKHLMLLFIWEGTGNPAFGSSFQNISCYCLSAVNRDLFHPQSHFKTSHVIVYPVLARKSIHNCAFQNISCYCLSALKMADKTIEEHFKTSHVIVYPLGGFKLKEPLIFQNISCYCLSCRFQDQLYTQTISKHLMLLFIGRAGKSENYIYHISKHLMLLFIEY